MESVNKNLHWTICAALSEDSINEIDDSEECAAPKFSNVSIRSNSCLAAQHFIFLG